MSESIFVCGGAEHPIGAALDDVVEAAWYKPGNAGTDELSHTQALRARRDPARLAHELQPGLTIVNAGEDLLHGLPERIRADGLAAVGPPSRAAQVGIGRIDAVRFMSHLPRKHGITLPYPRTVAVSSTLAAVTDNIEAQIPNGPAVLRLNSVARYRGGVRTESKDETLRTMYRLLSVGDQADGITLQDGVVIQEEITGPWVTTFVVTDGSERMLALPLQHDYADANAEGTAVAGMAQETYTPLPSSVSDAQLGALYEQADLALAGFRANGQPYRGVLSIRSRLAPERDGQPVVMEFNACMREPEAQVLMALLAEAGVDAYDLLRSTSEQLALPTTLPNPRKLGQTALITHVSVPKQGSRTSCGRQIHGLDGEYDASIYHGSGSTNRLADGRVVATGTTPLYVAATAKTSAAAARQVAAAVGPSAIHIAE